MGYIDKKYVCECLLGFKGEYCEKGRYEKFFVFICCLLLWEGMVDQRQLRGYKICLNSVDFEWMIKIQFVIFKRILIEIFYIQKGQIFDLMYFLFNFFVQYCFLNKRSVLKMVNFLKYYQLILWF